MKKKLTLLTILFGALVTNTINAEYADGSSCDNYAIPCPAVIDTCNGIYVDAEFLYWKAYENGLQYASTGLPITTASALPGNLEELDWKWKPGFRAGLGYQFGCDSWDLSLVYTWFRTHARSSITHLVGDILATWSADPTVFPSEASGNLHLQYQTLDLTLGKAFYIGQCVILEPTIAIRGARVKDTYTINYAAPTADVPTAEAIYNKQRLWAVGPKGGFNTSWNFCNNFSLIGEAAVSLLWANYDIHRFDETTTTGVVNNNIKNKFSDLKSVIEYRLGIGYDCGLCCDQYHLSIQLLWEEQQWINYNNMIYGPVNFDDLVQNRHTNLNLYGATVRAQLYF